MSDPSDAPSSSSWPIITSGGLISPWTRMRRAHGRCNRQPAARSSKCRTSAGSITITNAALTIALRAVSLGRYQEQARSIHVGLPTAHDVLIGGSATVQPLSQRRSRSITGSGVAREILTTDRIASEVPMEFLVGTGGGT